MIRTKHYNTMKKQEYPKNQTTLHPAGKKGPVALKAFTIMELIVTMILSLVLFSLLYLSYQILRQQVSQDDNGLPEILLLKECMTICMEEASLVTSSGDTLYFQSPVKSRSLCLGTDYILLEEEGKQDTVYKGAYNYKISQDQETGLVRQVMLDFTVDKQQVDFCSAKEYLPVIWLKRKKTDYGY